MKAMQNKETLLRLKAIESLIKSKTYRQLGYDKLQELEADSLSPEHQVFYHYLNARYYVYLFKSDKDIEHLEWANDYLDDMVSNAFEKKFKIKDTRYFFTRAYVKYELSLHVWEEERKAWFLEKAKQLTEKALRFHPENDSFLWLQTQFTN